MSLNKLLGSHVVGAKGEKFDVPSTDYVGLYFSAHWCGPCRGFTPELIKAYKKFKDEGKSFEIVFVSSDHDQKAFDGYFAEMPWLALPFSERDTKAKLSAKYKVRGIPTLVILDGKTGKTICTDARSALSRDPQGKDFPWRKKSLFEILPETLFNNQGAEVKTTTLKESTMIGIYFSAHWCPPCRQFTPVLVNTYNTMKAAGKKFEIVFVSGDQSDREYKKYFNEQPWLSVSYDEQEAIQALNELYGVEGIPSLILVDTKTGKSYDNGRSRVTSDQNGSDFPWMPKDVNSLENSVDFINDAACLIVLTNKASTDAQATLTTTAKQLISSWKSNNNNDDDEEEDDAPVRFVFGDNENAVELNKRVREMLKLQPDYDYVLLLNIPRGQKHISQIKPNSMSPADLVGLVHNFTNNKLAMETLK